MSVNKDILKNAFEVEFTKIGTVLCLNSIYGNSKIFGDKFDEYVAVCKFGYDGTHDTWVYSMYASEVFNKDNDVDLTPIAKFFGGGGHKHACGWTLSFNIFDRRSNAPYDYKPFITNMQKN
jgi:oligoribonuclease NrnB/cAMP/cGMP phosphodiesterase (DHH superfamily)